MQVQKTSDETLTLTITVSKSEAKVLGAMVDSLVWAKLVSGNVVESYSGFSKLHSYLEEFVEDSLLFNDFREYHTKL